MLKIFNYLTRKVELFKPIKKGRVGLYTCGPTVYDYAHIGNLRTYIFEDILKRTLKHSGYRVKHVMNLTDVDDKTIRGASKENIPLAHYTERYAQAFFENLNKLRIEPAAIFTKATEHIPEMIRLIKKLLKQGCAYCVDGSVYFDISKFKKYGRLSKLDLKGLKAGARVDVDEYAKDAAQDFVLWKAAKPSEPAWPAPFGAGRPGWHIECSAMSMKYLGESFDIHAGAVDLLFPHHEDEIAQSEAATGKPFVKYFVEGEHLFVEGEKMAKSLNNFLTLRDIEARGFDPLDFRFLVLQAHYRSRLNFTWQALAAAREGRKKLTDFIGNVKTYGSARPTGLPRPSTSSGLAMTVKRFQRQFLKSLQNDLDTPKALALVFDLVREVNPMLEGREVSIKDKGALERAIGYADSVFAVLPPAKARTAPLPREVKALAAEREELRSQNKFKEADEIRKKIHALGYGIEDTTGGARIRKNPNVKIPMSN